MYEFIVGVGKNTGTPVYRSISLVWYVPRHSGPYSGVSIFSNRKPYISIKLTGLKLKQLKWCFFLLDTIEFNLKMLFYSLGEGK